MKASATSAATRPGTLALWTASLLGACWDPGLTVFFCQSICNGLVPHALVHCVDTKQTNEDRRQRFAMIASDLQQASALRNFMRHG